MKWTAATVAVLAGTVAAELSVSDVGQLSGSILGTAQDAFDCLKASSQLSCHATYPIPFDDDALCCYNGALEEGGKESGLILSTQFWTTDAADVVNNGPLDSTTIHGLWPDYCDGTYPSYCNATSGIPEYTGAQIEALMQKYDPSLYGYYQQYFKDVDGDTAGFLEHEYNKHGTCYTTMRTQCQPRLPWISQPDFAVLNFFRQIAHKFAERPTYQILQAAGITPDAERTYQLADVQQALRNAHGATPFVGCNTNGEMNEFWYYWNVRGSVNFGQYVPVESSTPSTCPATLKYIPKP